MNTLIITAALFAQWDMAPAGPSSWDQSPAVALRNDYHSPKVPAPFDIDDPRLDRLLPNDSAEAAPTPQSEIDSALAALPSPEIGFVDFGCGADARWCVAAVRRWGCRAVGIELDRKRFERAQRRVKDLGLSHLILILHGDAVTAEIQADVGVAYLYPDVLEKLTPQIRKLRAFASYMHAPPGLRTTRRGDTWFYFKSAPKPLAIVPATPQPTQLAAVQRPTAVWDGVAYSGPACGNPRCWMCYVAPNSIQNQIQSQTSQQLAQAQTQPAQPKSTVGQCCCGGDTSKFCFCKQHFGEGHCKCTPTTGSVWHLNGEWSADQKIRPAEPLWMPPKDSQPASKPPAAIQPQTVAAPTYQYQTTYTQCNGRNCRVRQRSMMWASR